MTSLHTHARRSERPPLGARAIRTVLGDRSIRDIFGICDAHEHIVMRGARIRQKFPEFYRNSSKAILPDLQSFSTCGGGWVVDCTPPGSGRDAQVLISTSQISGLALVGATGKHLPRYYDPESPLLTMDREELADVFISEITRGMDDGTGRTASKAGVIKIASSGGALNSAERELFAAAGAAQAQTGCPIITHTEAGAECQQQIDVLLNHGATPEKVILSHCDRNPDIGFHCDLLQSGVCLEYDQHFRYLRRQQRCATIDLAVALADEFPAQLVVGMDLANNKYWSGNSGSPGLAWLASELPALLREAGVSEENVSRMTTQNPLEVFSFSVP